MRFLALHVDFFKSTVTQRGRSRMVEEVTQKETELQEGLVILVCTEKEDEAAPSRVAERAAAELLSLARQLKVQRAVLHPFAHLFCQPSEPQVAIQILDRVCQQLQGAGIATVRTPFGWFNTLELRAKGHPLSRVARMVTAGDA